MKAAFPRPLRPRTRDRGHTTGLASDKARPVTPAHIQTLNGQIDVRREAATSTLITLFRSLQRMSPMLGCSSSRRRWSSNAAR